MIFRANGFRTNGFRIQQKRLFHFLTPKYDQFNRNLKIFFCSVIGYQTFIIITLASSQHQTVKKLFVSAIAT